MTRHDMAQAGQTGGHDARSWEETLELAGSRRDRVSTHVVDITDRAAVAALPEAALAAHGQVDGLINCAGIIQPFVRFNDLEYEAIERITKVNYWGPIHTVKAFLPLLLERPEAHIVNISSMGGFVPVPGQTMYGTTKAAVMLFTQGLHSELVDTNVGVTLVFPGAIHTNISKNSGVGNPDGVERDASTSKIKMTEPDAAARMILDGMEKNAYRVMVGSDAKMMDRISRLAPLRAAMLIQKQMKELLAT
ncbi:MAG: SDR family oxidoreductase [Actinobacteria bacterium]|nr:SDR family oxidoreductase [Actinomycetota bacterium]